MQLIKERKFVIKGKKEVNKELEQFLIQAEHSMFHFYLLVFL